MCSCELSVSDSCVSFYIVKKKKVNIIVTVYLGLNHYNIVK